jgi:hypothetical protein
LQFKKILIPSIMFIIDMYFGLDCHNITEMLLKVALNTIIQIKLLCSWLLWKESVNNDGEQFYKYKQNKQLPLTSNNSTQERPQHMALEIQILTWNRRKSSQEANGE